MLDKNGYISGGSITYDGEDMAKYTAEQEWLKVRGKNRHGVPGSYDKP